MMQKQLYKKQQKKPQKLPKYSKRVNSIEKVKMRLKEIISSQIC